MGSPVSVLQTADGLEDKGKGRVASYHKTQVAPFVQKVAIHVYAVRLTKISRNEGPDGGQVLLLKAMLVADVL